MGRPRRKRNHPAASARILTAGLSSATALGLVAGMAVAGDAWQPGQQAVSATAGPVDRPSPAVSESAAGTAPVVVRRYWIAPPSPVATPATVPSVGAGAYPARPAAPAPRPVTRSHGS
jgi:hypothetical protein